MVRAVEELRLPAPLFEVPQGFTRVVLFGPRPLADIDRLNLVQAVYLHACLKWIQRDFLTNASVRERFGIEEANRSIASRLIRDAVDAGVIAAHDPDAGTRAMKYVPRWVSSETKGIVPRGHFS